jgi:DNA-binding transcriptional ArsR family regulator
LPVSSIGTFVDAVSIRSIVRLTSSPPRVAALSHRNERPPANARPFRRLDDELRALDHQFAGMNPRLLRVLGHPLRHRILIRLFEAEGSPREIADELTAEGYEHATTQAVANHIRTLVDAGLAALVRVERVRGAQKHIYRGAGDYFSDAEAHSLPVSVRRTAMARYAGLIRNDLRRAASTGGFDHPEVHATRIPLELDEEGFEEVRDIVNDAFERVMRARANAAERLARDPEIEPIRSMAAFLHFLRDATQMRNEEAAQDGHPGHDHDHALRRRR